MKFKSVPEIIVPEYVDQAIKILRENNASNMDIISDVSTQTYWNNPKIDNAITILYKWVNNKVENEDVFISAISNGYKTEPSKYEKFYDFYSKLDIATQFKFKNLLEILEINIEEYLNGDNNNG